MDEVLRCLREIKQELESRYYVDELAVFGSYRREQAHADSDLDILVSFREAPPLIELLELENMHTDLLGVEVDLVMEDVFPNEANLY